MGAFLVYILKSGIVLSFFYLFYRLLLSRETFHRLNRITLLGGLLLAMILPVVKIPSSVGIKAEEMAGEIIFTEIVAAPLQEIAPVMENTPATPAFIFIILTIYLIGICFSFLKISGSFADLFRLLRSTSPPLRRGKLKIHITDEPIAPFSWMNRIIISRKDWEENGEEILSHEAGHVRHLHSCDLLLAQLCTVLHWFNPAVWLIKRELQDIHEFEADNYVLRRGINIKRYQLLLIKKAVGSQRFTSMANSFNHSKLNKRITMMLKGKSNKWAYLKYLCILPVAVTVTTAFARPEIAGKFEQISEAKISDFFQEKKTDSPDNVTEKGTWTVTRVSGSVNIYGEEAEKKPLCIIDGKKVSTQEFEKISPEEIESISVLKDAAAIESYGAEGENGVIILTTKSAKEENIHIEISHKGSENVVAYIKNVETDIQINTTDVSEQALYIIDDVEVTKEEFEKKRSTLAHITVAAKGSKGNVIEKYGERGKNGVVIGKSKSPSRDITFHSSDSGIVVVGYADTEEDKKAVTINMRGSFTQNGENVLYILDGEKVTKEKLKDILPQTIKSVKVTQGEASHIYGGKDKDGVIIIETAPDKVEVVGVKIFPDTSASLVTIAKKILRDNSSQKINIGSFQ